MGINDKSLFSRGRFDRLHIKGSLAPSLELSVRLILDLAGVLHSPRNLSRLRREAIKLRERFPEPTVEQLKHLSLLDERLERKAQMINERLARKAEKKAASQGIKKPCKNAANTAPVPPPAESDPLFSKW